MYLYNTTFGFDISIEQDVIDWLKNEFIPTSVDDGEYFNTPELFYIRTQHEPGINSVALHMKAKSKEDIDNWYADHGSRLFDSLMKRWNGRVVYFSTTLETVK